MTPHWMRRAGLLVATLLFLNLWAPAQAAQSTVAVSGQQHIVDVNPGESNPCTGIVGTVTDDEFDHYHVTLLQDGTAHVTGGSVIEVSFVPDDPSQPAFTGHETSTMSQTLARNVTTFTATHNVTARGDDGSRIEVRSVSHVTLVGDQLVVAFDREELVCPKG